MSLALEKLLAPAQLAGLGLRNRVIKTATFEGMCQNGMPSDGLIRHHAEIAAGGTGLTTVAYCGVSPDGLTFKDQMWMHDGVRPQLLRLAAAVHAEGGAVSAQLAHCGNFSRNKPRNIPRPRGPSRSINQYGLLSGLPLGGAMTAADIRKTIAEYAAAAAFVKDVGFDAIEIHMGHGYLLSQFISPALNKRRDEYGGSLENRMRLPLEILAAVRKAVGVDFPLLAKLNLSDGFATGLQIDEACRAAQLLERGGLNAIVMSGGVVSRTSMYLFRGTSPLAQMIPLEKNPLQRKAMQWFGAANFQELPYEELYFLDLARQMRRSVKMPLVYLGGVSSAAGMRRVMEEGFDFIAMGRALLQDQNLLQRVREQGESWVSRCNHCNQCVASMALPGGTRCVLDEPRAFVR
ncbi:4,4'-dithiodibutanoate disulfide reductase [Pseudomonas jessenii]|jgi:2,4-dienoyl-CoA reductase-like NADH-dependent reductase (Old Yellow Enzyme family)|uniref:NADH:flavin oxidoreductase n=1 Tax=Pseudomonas laurylsulfatiphila TaxID=2011015 RepID=A0A2S6FM64_9PSED|nr:NADH:flavin oxidoreductase [Pseudomonas laurylsulfatiphila]PPK38511.1 NADH:flavin oxidoreductase [Pseudomonas laurylsulfatiphila]